MLEAIIDIGSNTARMAIYQIQGQEAQEVLKRKDTRASLASFLRGHALSKEGIGCLIDALENFQAILRTFRVRHVHAFATGALRGASNREAALEEIQRITGLQVRILSGEEEATLGFLGATHGLATKSGLLVDIGGATTELVRYEGREILHKTSLPIGSRRLFANYVEGLLPATTDILRMREAVAAVLSPLKGFEAPEGRPLCGIGGTFKGAYLLHRELWGDAPEGIPLACLSEMLQRFQRGRALPEEDAVALMRAAPERMLTLLPGLIIAEAIGRLCKAQRFVYSDSGVREGFLYKTLRTEN